MPTEHLHKSLHDGYGIHAARFPEFKGHDVIRSAVLQPDLMQRLVTALGTYNVQNSRKSVANRATQS
jgi:hypothetical protein